LKGPFGKIKHAHEFPPPHTHTCAVRDFDLCVCADYGATDACKYATKNTGDPPLEIKAINLSPVCASDMGKPIQEICLQRGH